MADQGQEHIAAAPGLSAGLSGRAGATEMKCGIGGPESAVRRLGASDASNAAAAWTAGEPAADVWSVPEEDDTLDGDAQGASPAGAALHTTWLRVQARQQLREFLRAIPRHEPGATLAIMRTDGSTRLFTRAELSGAIDHLRPRQRQIIRLAIEERWPRRRVCEYLRHISIKTFERDQVEALDLLAQM